MKTAELEPSKPSRSITAKAPVRRPALLWVFALTCGGLVGCPSVPTRNPKASMTFYKLGHDYFSRAVKAKNSAVRDRFLNVALVELRRSIKHDDQNSHSHFLIALIYLHKGQAASEEIDTLQCLRGAEAAEYQKEADALMRKALRHLQQAHAMRGGRDSRIALNLSTVHLFLKNYKKAEELGRKALTDIAYSTPYLARCNIGRAQLYRGNYARALKNLKQAVFTQRRFCAGHYWLGRVEFEQKKYDKSAQDFGRALTCCTNEKLPPIQDAQLYYGLSLVRLGRQQEALAIFQKCVKQAPKSCVAVRCAENLKSLTGSKP